MILYDATAAIIPPAERAAAGMVFLPVIRPHLNGSDGRPERPDPTWADYGIDRENDGTFPCCLLYSGMNEVAPCLDKFAAELRACETVSPRGRKHWIGPQTNDSGWAEKGDTIAAASCKAAFDGSVQQMNIRGVSSLVHSVGIYGYADPRVKPGVYGNRLARGFGYIAPMNRTPEVWITPWVTESMGAANAGQDIAEAYHWTAWAVAQRFNANIVVWAVNSPASLLAYAQWVEAHARWVANGSPAGSEPVRPREVRATFAELQTTSLWRLLTGPWKAAA